MSEELFSKDLGVVTAYGYAKSMGYTGTEAEFAQLMADYASVGTAAAASAAAAAESAEDAEAYAVGTRDGSPVTSGDPAYENNAKYYAQQLDISDVWDKIYAAYVTEQDSGAVVSFSDGADDVPVKELAAEISGYQEGSGTSAPDNIRPLVGFSGAKIIRAATSPDSGKTYTFLPVQAGSGDPSVSNMRAITPGLTITRDDNSTLSVWGGLYDPLNKTITEKYAEINYDGSEDESWSYNPQHVYLQTSPTNAWIINPLYCDSYKTISAEYPESGSLVYGTTYVRFSPPEGSNVTNAATWRTYLSTHTIQLVYPIKASSHVTYQLSDTEAARVETALGITLEQFSADWSDSAGTAYDGDADLTAGLLTADTFVLTLDGSEYWREQGTHSYFFYNFPTPNGTLVVDDESLGSHSVDNSAITNSNSQTGHRVYNRGSSTPTVLIRFDSTKAQTREEFVAYLTAQYAAGTPVQVTYKLQSAEEVSFSPVVLPTRLGANSIFADTGDVDVTWRADTKLYIQSALS